MRPILLALFIYSTLSVFCQENCNKRSDWWKNYSRFIPHEPRAPLTVKVNFIVPQKSDGSANFQEGDPEVDKVWKQTFEKVNALYRDLKDPKDKVCYTGEDFIPNTYIQFVLNAKIYFQDDEMWRAENGSGCPREKNWWLNKIDKEIRQDERYANAINVYMPNKEADYIDVVIEKTKVRPKSTPPCSELPTFSDLGRSSRINLAGSYNKYWYMKNTVPNDSTVNPKLETWEQTIISWQISTVGHTLAHELGHSLGLHHGNEYHGRNQCKTALMNQRHNTPHNYVQPTEIGKMHRALRLSNIRDFVIADVYSEYPLRITEDAEIDISHKSYEDIIVADGATLTVSCELLMPSEGKVIIEPGGTLNINGGQVKGSRGVDQWRGVTIQKERGCFLKKKSKRRKGQLNIDENGSLTSAPSTQVEKIKRTKK